MASHDAPRHRVIEASRRLVRLMEAAEDQHFSPAIKEQAEQELWNAIRDLEDKQ